MKIGFRLWSILILLGILASQSLWAKKYSNYFIKQIFSVDFSITQAIEAGYVNGKLSEDQAKEIIIVGETDDHQRIVAIYKKTVPNAKQSIVADYQLLRKIIIDDQFIAYDFYSGANKQFFLMALSAKGLSRFNLNSGKKESIATLESLYLNKDAQFLLRKKLVKDLNHDGLDDIIVSGFSHLNLLIQQPNGQFKTTTLPIKPFIDMERDKVSYSDHRIYTFDANQDQLLDIATLEDNQLLVYLQQSNGAFEQQAQVIDLPSHASSRAWWYKREADGSYPDQSKVKHKMLEMVTDINGDKVVDLVVRETQSHSVFDINNNYSIYWGKMLKQGLIFEKKIGTAIHADGTLTGLILKDLNNNGKKEVLVSSFELGVSQIIGALLSGSVDQDVYLYALDSNNYFSQQPIFSGEVDLHFSLSSGKSGQPVILTSDLNGDKKFELLLSNSQKRLAIYSGIQSSKLVAKRYQKYSILLPKDGAMLKSIDLNEDDKQAIVIHYGKQDDPSLRNKVIILRYREPQ
ncbi:MAG: VCBS repeat-containing protein [Enterobacterales bacterium]|nr:VCBS repeat-containing protein [Enterobacterales bacterium]